MSPPRAETIRSALREIGLIEGQNITIEYRYAEGRQDLFPKLAAELVHLNVDIIVVLGGDILVQAAKNATKTIAIVITGGGLDPVEAGLVESLASPGANVTGLTNLSRKLGGKRLELLKEAVPKVAHVAVLYDPASGSEVEVKEDLPVAARALGLTLRPWEVRAADDLEKIFASMRKERADGLYVPARGPLMNANEKRIADFALKSGLPSVYSYRAGVDAGGLVYYGADLAHIYRRVAYYVDKILKGAKPAGLIHISSATDPGRTLLRGFYSSDIFLGCDYRHGPSRGGGDWRGWLDRFSSAALDACGRWHSQCRLFARAHEDHRKRCASKVCAVGSDKRIRCRYRR